MGFTPDQISLIGKLKAEGQTWEDIASSLGSKPDTVRMAYKRSQHRTEQPAEQSPARTRTTKRKANRTEQTEQPAEQTERRQVPVEIVAPRITRSMTLNEMADLLAMAKNGFERAASQEDESKRTWMETSYMKIMRDILVQMGKWCGLDDTVHEETRANVVRASDVEGMSLDDMRRIVREL